jgi:hypothetical protein
MMLAAAPVKRETPYRSCHYQLRRPSRPTDLCEAVLTAMEDERGIVDNMRRSDLGHGERTCPR